MDARTRGKMSRFCNSFKIAVKNKSRKFACASGSGSSGTASDYAQVSDSHAGRVLAWSRPG